MLAADLASAQADITEELDMKIIRCSQESRLVAPVSPQSPEATAVWLSSMSDSGWRSLIDFRNWPNWIPGMQDVEQMDQESPARGTQLQIKNGNSQASCSIDHWDPPRCLCFSVDAAGGELAYGFTIEVDPGESELLVTLELERSVHGLTRLLAFLLEWRLRQMGARLLTNLTARLRPSIT